MWSTGYDEEEDYCVRDSVYGVISSRCSSGVFIRLDNGEIAFSKFWGSIGQRVLCSVRRKATENRRAFVTVDSVLYDTPLQAA